MDWRLEPYPCDGYPKTQTWVIRYSFNGGKHQITKKSFSGDYRTAYIPNTTEG
jgi:hypothetical protein